nr:nuclear transcription factor Y subunit gamma isoform X4 [Gorilla gorilla gorilla]
MLCSCLAGRCRRRRARGVRVPRRPGPRAFSHWRKATAGGLARDWSVAGRPRTWHLIGRASSGLGGLCTPTKPTHPLASVQRYRPGNCASFSFDLSSLHGRLCQDEACPGTHAIKVVEMSTEGGFGGTSSSDAQQSLQSFWPRVMEEIRNLTVKDFRVQELPLARIKKIMKLDEDVKMISAEAPVLFAKAAQIFITELTLRAWIHTEDNKRRTLQRNDIAMAITKFDQFDFLIDIVPRDELKPPKRQEEVRQSVTPAEPVQYYFTLAQQPTAVQVQGQQQGQQTTSSTTTIQPGQIIIAQPQQGQTTPVTMQVGEGQQVQIVQAQPQGQAQQAQSGTGQTMQVMQQIITNTGEIQQIPVQLNAGQLQYIRLAQPVSGTQVVQGQIQTLATNAQQITQTEVQQGQQQFSQFTDGQQLYQIQQVTMPAGQDLAQPMFIQSANQPSDGQAPQVTGD